MEYLEIIINILAKELHIERCLITEAVQKNHDIKNGDYSILCYKLINSFKENPLIIAEKIKKIMIDNNFTKVEVIGPYVNIFLNKKQEYKERVLIANFISGDRINILQDIYNLIISEFVSKIYLENGYEVEKYNYNRKNDSRITTKYLLKRLAEKGVHKKYKDNNIVNLKRYNLPPLILDNNYQDRYLITISAMEDILQKQEQNSSSKSVIIINKYEKIRYKQIMALASILTPEEVNNFNNLNLGVVKINKNIKEISDLKECGLEYFLAKAKESIKAIMLSNDIVLQDNEIEEVVWQTIIFNFLKKDLPQDIILDYNEIFKYEENSYLYLKVKYKKIENEIKKIENEILKEVIDLKNEKQLINIIEEYESVLRETLEKFQGRIIINYINRIISRIDDFNLNNEKYMRFAILKKQKEIIENLLDILGVNNKMLTKAIQKLTVY